MHDGGSHRAFAARAQEPSKTLGGVAWIMSEPSRERQLESILHAYLQDVDSGKKPDRDELLRRHPALADDLGEFFADQEKMDLFARSMHQAQVGEVTTIGAN